MKIQTLKLSENFINMLVSLPETGMGYQIVKVILKNGNVLHRQKVLNSELLMLDENDKIITNQDIDRIELENS